jgi:short-subunit dehydrogenase
MDLKHKTIWITGASSGIGRALVFEAARRGANVILSARSLADLKSVQREAGLTAQNSLIIPLDLSKYKQFSKPVSQALRKFGAVDILINNGGISQRSLAHETQIKVYEEIMAVNYFGNIALTLALLPSMRARRSGIVATVSSVAGKFGTPMRTGYSASKFATNGFYEALRAENFRENIQVSIIMPGFVRTNVSLNARVADGKKQGKMDAAQNQGMSPEQCARQAMAGILRGKNEIYIGGFKEMLAVTVNRFFPNIFARIIRKAKVT